MLVTNNESNNVLNQHILIFYSVYEFRHPTKSVSSSIVSGFMKRIQLRYLEIKHWMKSKHIPNICNRQHELMTDANRYMTCKYVVDTPRKK